MRPTARLAPSLSAAFAFCLVVTMAGAVALAAEPAPVPAAPAASADVAKLFRFHAGAQARALGDAVERASFDEAQRGQLRSLVREHLRRVDDELPRAAAGAAAPDGSLDDLLDRATSLARDFNDKQVAAWLDEHPAAYQPVQEQIALAEAYERAVVEEPEAVVRAARAAGLAEDREAALRRTVTDAHERLNRANDADAKKVRDVGEKAAAAQPPGAGRGPDARPPDRGEPDPRAHDARREPPAPNRAPAPPLTPEARRVQLLDALAFVDAHERLAAAGREVRGEVEKLLPEAPRRKALEDEMLRWYQSFAPPPPDDPAQKDAPPSKPSRQPAAPSDPGF